MTAQVHHAQRSKCKQCGQPVTEHSRCEGCRPGRQEAERRARARSREEVLTAEVRAELLRRLEAGENLAQVAPELGVTHQRVWAAAELDSSWATELDQALMRGRPDHLEHGRPLSYKEGCRCPECRVAKREQRGVRQVLRPRVPVPTFRTPAG